MRILFPPALVFYTDNMEQGMNGMTVAFIVFIRKGRENDKGLLEHELTHVKQFWRTAGTHGVRYNIDDQYRFRCEVEAYKCQLKYNPEYIEKYATALVNKYDIENLTYEQALAALRKNDDSNS